MTCKKLEVYDYETEYNNKIIREEAFENINFNSSYNYVKKTITSGSLVEVEIYPIPNKKNDVRSEKKKRSSKEQEKINKKNKIKNFIRLVHTNFKENDLFITLTYKDKYLPNEEEARKDITNYLNKIKRYRKKENLEDIKYIYAISYENDKIGSKKIRIHHHLIINKMDRDIAEKLWVKGRSDARKLQYDQNLFEGVARYIANQSKKRIGHSRNLKKPTITIDRTTLTRRKVENLAINETLHKEYFEKKYYKCRYIESTSYSSSNWPGVFIYVKLRKDEMKEGITNDGRRRTTCFV
ncbi:MAG: hypothetical protein HUJ88_11605 [Fusobacterium necrophorum]|nr:hypothetical protein [Fusobacterium necrophorum]